MIIDILILLGFFVTGFLLGRLVSYLYRQAKRRKRERTAIIEDMTMLRDQLIEELIKIREMLTVLQYPPSEINKITPGNRWNGDKQ